MAKYTLRKKTEGSRNRNSLKIKFELHGTMKTPVLMNVGIGKH